MTQNFRILIICLVTSVIAQKVRKGMGVHSLIDRELDDRGVSLREGRSVVILDSLLVKDAMVVDHLEVYEHETVAELREKAQKGKYPFLVVVNAQRAFKGLLTVDMIQEGWEEQKEGQGALSALEKLVEAKDFLYRSRFKSPSVRVTDSLTVTAGLFNEMPCVPVLGEEEKVCGLLFSYSVRLAYDHELARRSFLFMREGRE